MIDIFNTGRIVERVWTSNGNACLVVLLNQGWRCGYIGYHQPNKIIREAVISEIEKLHVTSGNLSWTEHFLPWEKDDDADYRTLDMVWFGIDYKDWGIDVRATGDAFSMDEQARDILRNMAANYKLNCPANEETVWQDIQNLSDEIVAADAAFRVAYEHGGL